MAKNKVIVDQKLDCLEVVALQFKEEMENISPLEPRRSLENLELRALTTKKTKKTKAAPSKPEGAQQSIEMSA